LPKGIDVRGNSFQWGKVLTIPRLLVLSFATVILVGGALLAMDFTRRSEPPKTVLIDAMFTATSAVCVTGLSVCDIGKDYNALGQAIVLVLIQIGGLGILTFSNFLLLLSSGHMSLHQRQIVEAMFGSQPHVTPRILLKRVIIYALTIESLGAALLTARFMADFPFPKALWLGVFHAVSAFCNSGLSLFSDSLAAYRADWFLNATVMSLIVLGGLGFVVFSDLAGYFRRAHQSSRRILMLHTRIVLLTTILLISVGAAGIFILESRGSTVTGPWYQRILESVFLSITARTAGFNTVDTGALTNGTLLLVILLMTIGGSPGSTAGGIKTTTFAIILALITTSARNRPRVELFSRTIPVSTVTKALITAASFLLAAAICTLALQVTELPAHSANLDRGHFLNSLFEVVSALGTVGLSTGMTPALTSMGKLIIMGCMFAGRLGPLMIASSILGHQRVPDRSYPEETVIVG